MQEYLFFFNLNFMAQVQQPDDDRFRNRSRLLFSLTYSVLAHLLGHFHLAHYTFNTCPFSISFELDC